MSNTKVNKRGTNGKIGKVNKSEKHEISTYGNKEMIVICNMKIKQQTETINTHTKEIPKHMQHILQTQTKEKKYKLEGKNMQHILQTTTKALQRKMQHILQTINEKDKTTDKVVDWLGFRTHVLKVSQSRYKAAGGKTKEKNNYASTARKNTRKLTRRETRVYERKTTGGKEKGAAKNHEQTTEEWNTTQDTMRNNENLNFQRNEGGDGDIQENRNGTNGGDQGDSGKQERNKDEMDLNKVDIPLLGTKGQEQRTANSATECTRRGMLGIPDHSHTGKDTAGNRTGKDETKKRNGGIENKNGRGLDKESGTGMGRERTEGDGHMELHKGSRRAGNGKRNMGGGGKGRGGGDQDGDADKENEKRDERKNGGGQEGILQENDKRGRKNHGGTGKRIWEEDNDSAQRILCLGTDPTLHEKKERKDRHTVHDIRGSVGGPDGREGVPRKGKAAERKRDSQTHGNGEQKRDIGEHQKREAARAGEGHTRQEEENKRLNRGREKTTKRLKITERLKSKPNQCTTNRNTSNKKHVGGNKQLRTTRKRAGSRGQHTKTRQHSYSNYVTTGLKLKLKTKVYDMNLFRSAHKHDQLMPEGKRAKEGGGKDKSGKEFHLEHREQREGEARDPETKGKNRTKQKRKARKKGNGEEMKRKGSSPGQGQTNKKTRYMVRMTNKDIETIAENKAMIDRLTPEIPKPIKIIACTHPEDDGTCCSLLFPDNGAYERHCVNEHEGMIHKDHNDETLWTEQRKDLVKHFWMTTKETLFAMVKFMHHKWGIEGDPNIQEMMLSTLRETALEWIDGEQRDDEMVLKEMMREDEERKDDTKKEGEPETEEIEEKVDEEITLTEEEEGETDDSVVIMEERGLEDTIATHDPQLYKKLGAGEVPETKENKGGEEKDENRGGEKQREDEKESEGTKEKENNNEEEQSDAETYDGEEAEAGVVDGDTIEEENAYTGRLTLIVKGSSYVQAIAVESGSAFVAELNLEDLVDKHQQIVMTGIDKSTRITGMWMSNIRTVKGKERMAGWKAKGYWILNEHQRVSTKKELMVKKMNGEDFQMIEVQVETGMETWGEAIKEEGERRIRKMINCAIWQHPYAPILKTDKMTGGIATEDKDKVIRAETLELGLETITYQKKGGKEGSQIEKVGNNGDRKHRLSPNAKRTKWSMDTKTERQIQGERTESQVLSARRKRAKSFDGEILSRQEMKERRDLYELVDVHIGGIEKERKIKTKKMEAKDTEGDLRNDNNLLRTMLKIQEDKEKERQKEIDRLDYIIEELKSGPHNTIVMGEINKVKLQYDRVNKREGEIDEREAGLERRKQRLDKKESELTEKQLKAEIKRREAEKALSEVEEGKKGMREKEKEINKRMEEEKLLIGRHKEMETEGIDWKGRKPQKDINCVEKMQAEITMLKQKAAGQQDYINKLSQEKETLKHKRGKAEDALRKIAKERPSEAKITELRAKVTDYEAKFRMQKNELAYIKGQVEKKEVDLRNMSTEKDKAQRKYERILKKSKDTNQTLEEQKFIMEELRKASESGGDIEAGESEDGKRAEGTEKDVIIAQKDHRIRELEEQVGEYEHHQAKEMEELRKKHKEMEEKHNREMEKTRRDTAKDTKTKGGEHQEKVKIKEQIDELEYEMEELKGRTEREKEEVERLQRRWEEINEGEDKINKRILNERESLKAELRELEKKREGDSPTTIRHAALAVPSVPMPTEDGKKLKEEKKKNQHLLESIELLNKKLELERQKEARWAVSQKTHREQEQNHERMTNMILRCGRLEKELEEERRERRRSGETEGKKQKELQMRIDELRQTTKTNEELRKRVENTEKGMISDIRKKRDEWQEEWKERSEKWIKEKVALETQARVSERRLLSAEATSVQLAGEKSRMEIMLKHEQEQRELLEKALYSNDFTAGMPIEQSTMWKNTRDAAAKDRQCLMEMIEKNEKDLTQKEIDTRAAHAVMEENRKLKSEVERLEKQKNVGGAALTIMDENQKLREEIGKLTEEKDGRETKGQEERGDRIKEGGKQQRITGKLGPIKANTTWSEKWGEKNEIEFSTEKASNTIAGRDRQGMTWIREGRIYDQIPTTEDEELVIETSGSQGYMDSQILIKMHGKKYGQKDSAETMNKRKMDNETKLATKIQELRELEGNYVNKRERYQWPDDQTMDDIIDKKNEIDRILVKRHQYMVMEEEEIIKEINSDTFHEVLEEYNKLEYDMEGEEQEMDVSDTTLQEKEIENK